VNPFLAGQRLTAGQLNDATQKTLKSIEVSTAGIINTTSGTTQLDIPKMALGPIPQVNGGLYQFNLHAIVQASVATDEFKMLVRRDTALTGTIIQEWTIFAAGITTARGVYPWDDFVASATEDVNYFVSLQRTSGTGTLAIYGQYGTGNRSGIACVRVGYSSEFAVIP
jgi:hypothetical protein